MNSLNAEIGLGLPPENLAAVFPFHFAFDTDLRVRQCGPALLKLLPGMASGSLVTEFVRIITPNVPFEFGPIEQQSFTVFFIDSLDKRFKLKGQMLKTVESGKQQMLFLGSPVVRELGLVSGLGLNLKDFAIHDSAVDFLILLQTKTNTINDVKGMAERLKKEVAERREAQKELQASNEQLEQRVKERTSALEVANHELQSEIGERSRAEERVRVANAQLSAMVNRLEEHNRQMRLLNVMGDMLQACRTVAETYAVISDSLAQLFPGESGSLALLGNADPHYQVVAAWGGDGDQLGTTFLRGDCWGLRRARVHEHQHGDSESVCPHVRTHMNLVPGSGYVCSPLATQGELHGLLHLHGAAAQPGQDMSPDHENDRRQLLHSASEHIALAVANLKLQDHLRQQSIRDVLTGLYNRRHMEDALRKEMSRSNRSKKPFGVIMIDVDHFKKFNDNHGHQAGDALLRGLGAFLQSHVRGEDIACRYGGEEFILILPGAYPEGAAIRAEEIRAGVEQNFKVPYDDGFLPQVTISLGVAVYPIHAAKVDEVVKAADAALYQSKQDGRNRYTVSISLPNQEPA